MKNKNTLTKFLITYIIDNYQEAFYSKDISPIVNFLTSKNIDDAFGNLDLSGVEKSTAICRAAYHIFSYILDTKEIINNVKSLGWPLAIMCLGKKGVDKISVNFDVKQNDSGNTFSRMFAFRCLKELLSPITFDTIEMNSQIFQPDVETYTFIDKLMKKGKFDVKKIVFSGKSFYSFDNKQPLDTIIIVGPYYRGLCSVSCKNLIIDNTGKEMPLDLTTSANVNNIDLTKMDNKVILSSHLYRVLQDDREYFKNTKLLLRKDQTLAHDGSLAKVPDISNHIVRI